MKRWIIMTLMILVWQTFVFADDTTTLELALAKRTFNWDPQWIEHDDEYLLYGAVYQGLVRLDPASLMPLPAIAESWSVSSDGLQYRFVLRAKARFSDGSPITAESFYRSFLRLIDPRQQNPNAELLYMVQGVQEYSLAENTNLKDVGIEVESERVLIFHLKHPAPYFFEILAHPALSPLSGTQLPLKWNEPQAIPFSGPYLFAGTTAEGFTLRRNRLYWDADKTEITIINVKLFADEINVNEALSEAKIDWAHNFFATNKSLGEYSQIMTNQRFSSRYFLFLATDGPYAQTTIRRALIMLLPLHEVREKTLPKAQSLVPPNKDYPTILGLQSDYSEGMMLLEQAGYPEGEGLPTLTIAAFSIDDPQVTAMQQAWQQAGINVEIVVYSEDDYYSNKNESERPALIEQGWAGEYLDPLAFLSMWQSFSRHNYSNFRSPRFDAMIEQSHLLTGLERLHKLAESEALLLASGVIIPMQFLIDVDALKMRDIEGIGRNPLGKQSFERLSKRKGIPYQNII